MAGLMLSEIAAAVGGAVQGEDVLVTGAAGVEDAAPGDIVLAESARFVAAAEQSDAAAVVAPAGDGLTKPAVVVEDPRAAFAQILALLAPKVWQPVPGVDPSCRVSDRLALAEGAAVGYGCFIGSDVEIGEGAVVYPLCYLGDGVKIGARSVLYPGAVVYHGCEIGSRVTIHSGAVVGADGFGFMPVGAELKKIPQIGTVVIEDDVEIGANTTIDRAKTGVTRIGRGTKIDNLVHIAHNVKTGQMCILVAQVGVAGSTEIGNGVVIAGQAGLKDHVKIGDRAVVAGQAGIISDVPAGATYSGYPAQPHREWLRGEAMIKRLPEMQKTIDTLRKEIEDLKSRVERLTDGD